MSLFRPSLLFLSPVLLVTSLVLIERSMFSESGPQESLNSRLETVKMAVQLSSDLVTMFIGIATAIIGGTAYYLRTRVDEFGPIRSLTVLYVIACLVSAVLSIYFGHLTVTTLRNQLIHDAFEGASPALQWSERLQFASLILSLGWFGLLVVDRESDRQPTKDGSPGPTVTGSGGSGGRPQRVARR